MPPAMVEVDTRPSTMAPFRPRRHSQAPAVTQQSALCGLELRGLTASGAGKREPIASSTTGMAKGDDGLDGLSEVVSQTGQEESQRHGGGRTVNSKMEAISTAWPMVRVLAPTDVPNALATSFEPVPARQGRHGSEMCQVSHTTQTQGRPQGVVKP